MYYNIIRAHVPGILELADSHSSGHEELLLKRGQG